MASPFRIILTGAPASGKSTFVNRFNECEFVWKNHTYTFHKVSEQASILLNRAPGLVRSDPSEFARTLICMQIVEEEAMEILHGTPSEILLLDRCIWDIQLFHPKSVWTDVVGKTGISMADIRARYNRDHLIHMESVAMLSKTGGWPGNNPVRLHGREESKVLHMKSVSVLEQEQYVDFKSVQYVKACAQSEQKSALVWDCICNIFEMEFGTNIPWPT